MIPGTRVARIEATERVLAGFAQQRDPLRLGRLLQGRAVVVAAGGLGVAEGDVRLVVDRLVDDVDLADLHAVGGVHRHPGIAGVDRPGEAVLGVVGVHVGLRRSRGGPTEKAAGGGWCCREYPAIEVSYAGDAAV